MVRDADNDTRPGEGISSHPAPSAGAEPSLGPDETTLQQHRPGGTSGKKLSVPPPPPTLARGTHVGDYIIDRLLAQGGFSVVYRATHAERGTPVALKVLHADLVSHPDAILRFGREVEAIQRLEHPNVVVILDHGRLDRGHPHYVMELLEGVSLDEHLCARGRLPAEEVLAILEPLCSALAAVHRCGIVHRDIKASNIFLCEQDGRRRVVLLDFGVAKLLDAPGPALTSSRHIVGTVSSMSPEQLLGEAVDPRTDVYALGVLTYRMLVGQPPFVERSYPMLRQLHLHVSPPRPSTRARVNPAFDDLILRAMGKNRQDRPPTIAAFLDEFRATMELIRGRGAGAPHPGARVRQALAIYAEVHAEASALAEPEDSLLADLEAILPFIAAELTSAGLSAAAETGGSVLFTVDRPDELAGERETRRRLMDTVLAIHRQLEARAERDPRVHVRLCLHAGELVDTGQGAPVGGELLELAAWVPDEAEDGVFASPEVLADLEIASTPGNGALRRIATPPEATRP